MTDPDSAMAAAATTTTAGAATPAAAATTTTGKEGELKGPHGLEGGEEALGRSVLGMIPRAHVGVWVCRLVVPASSRATPCCRTF